LEEARRQAGVSYMSGAAYVRFMPESHAFVRPPLPPSGTGGSPPVRIWSNIVNFVNFVPSRFGHLGGPRALIEGTGSAC